MKPVKKAQQKNVQIETEYYIREELEELEKIEGVFRISEDTDEEPQDDDLRVSLDSVKDIKVVLDEYGSYGNVVVMNTGETIHVIL